jgi:hypothetical protein
MLSTFGDAERLYLRVFTRPLDVTVVEAGCHVYKNGCIPYARLATLDGRRLAPELHQVAAGRRVGERLTVRWDRLGYATPTSTYPSLDPPSVPVWVPGTVAALYAALTALFALGVRRAAARPR